MYAAHWVGGWLCRSSWGCAYAPRLLRNGLVCVTPILQLLRNAVACPFEVCSAIRQREKAVDMRFFVEQSPLGRRRGWWRQGMPLAALIVATSAQAQWVIPAGSAWDMGGGATDLACTDLVVEGALTVGSGGSVTGVRNVLIASGGSLSLAGGTVQLSQQWTNQGVFTPGGGQVVRVDGGVACPAAGPIGPIGLSPASVPATSPGMLAALTLLLAGLGWRHTTNRRRGFAPQAAPHASNTHSDRSHP